MLAVRTIISVVTLFWLIGCAVPLEHVIVPGGLPGWKIGYEYREEFTNTNIREIIPQNEAIDKWTKMITIQYYSGRKDDTEAFMNALEMSMKKRCKETMWKVIEKNNNSILYEWKIKNCSPNDDQHEISKLFIGNDGLHRAAYTEKVQNMQSNVRDEWVKRLSSSYLEKDGKRINGL